MSLTMDDWKKDIREAVKHDIIQLEDGFKYYYPPENAGALQSYELREIADLLDEMNKPYEDMINEYFENND